MKTITILSSPFVTSLNPKLAPQELLSSNIDIGATGKRANKFNASQFLSIKPQETKVDSKTLSKNLKDFLESMKPVLDATDDKVGSFSVKEIELRLAVSAEGGITLIGHLTAGIETSITIKLSR